MKFTPGPLVNGKVYYSTAQLGDLTQLTIAVVTISDKETYELTLTKRGMTRTDAIALAQVIEAALGGE